MSHGGPCTDWAALLRMRDAWRTAGRTVIWTNGCFDLFHAGHARFLEAARALGDVLVVGLNSDESVRRLKGSPRPFLDFASRATILRAMRAVDHVVGLREDVPCPEIAELKPDVCCKDDDYAGLPLPERAVVEAHGGQMRLLPRIGGFSTTELARRIGAARPSRGER